MRAPLLIILVAALTLGGCASVRESRLNPFNWFGGATEERVTETPRQVVVTDPRGLVDEVVDMSVDRAPGGAIVHATGRPSRQGYWEADLVPLSSRPDENGVLVFDFRVAPPPGPTRIGTAPSREVTAAAFLTDQALQGVRAVVVRGARNQRRATR
ncbi:hypothetical protein SAMN05444722_1115 [Rhodovulum sp. ES.010]|uniref:hypothetical protein n=1 Tax=Rhodovulum sp. ES.010 TaxID=1882821 RepID=UPI00092A5E51|nr:hypothetical protein [Rhodovulum sp. ES.010]SIO26993.1 hypothetical protein SAMN05444722_1115 [Rhodovulum sp. ES.010]